MQICYQYVKLMHGYRMDFVVNDMLVLKEKESLLNVGFAQLLTCLRLGIIDLDFSKFKRAQTQD